MRAGSPTGPPGPGDCVVGPTLGGTGRAISHCRRDRIAVATQRLEVRLKPKGPEDYRRLAEKCRETAHTVSTEKERADLLAMAQIWDLIAGRVG